MLIEILFTLLGTPAVPRDVQNTENLSPQDALVPQLLSQGDNRNVEEILRTVVVNVNLSCYFKIMLFMLTVNTLLMFKWIIWDHLQLL